MIAVYVYPGTLHAEDTRVNIILMTSLYPSTTGIYFNSGQIGDSPVTDIDRVMTRRFEKEGYHVTAAGNPLWDWGTFPERDEQMPDYKIAEWAGKQLRESYDQPLFLGIGFYRPHVPMYTPRKWFNLYPEETTMLPEVNPEDLDDISDYAYKMTHLEYIEPPHPYHEWMLENKEWLNFVRSYLASISFVDHQIDKVLDAYEKSSFNENTYIVLFGDHGFHLGEKEAWAKQTLWENGTRTPLIVIGPGIPEGKIQIISWILITIKTYNIAMKR